MIPKSHRYGVVKDGVVTFVGNEKEAVRFKKVWQGTVWDGAYRWNVGDKKNLDGGSK